MNILWQLSFEIKFQLFIISIKVSNFNLNIWRKRLPRGFLMFISTKQFLKCDLNISSDFCPQGFAILVKIEIKNEKINALCRFLYPLPFLSPFTLMGPTYKKIGKSQVICRFLLIHGRVIWIFGYFCIQPLRAFLLL